jgi:hypothetical protein
VRLSLFNLVPKSDLFFITFYLQEQYHDKRHTIITPYNKRRYCFTIYKMEDLLIHNASINRPRKKKQNQWKSINNLSEGDALSSTPTSKSSSDSLALLSNQYPACFIPTIELPASRQLIHVSSTQTATFHANLAQKFLANHQKVDMTGLENAIMIALDAANLLQRRKIARIVL